MPALVVGREDEDEAAELAVEGEGEADGRLRIVRAGPEERAAVGGRRAELDEEEGRIV